MILDSIFLEILKKQFDIEITDRKNDGKKIADCILRLSDFYIQFPDSPTPWQERWCQIAYLGYYLPLNFLRAKKVVERGYERNFFAGFESLIDFGSGLGSGSLALSEIHNQYFVEKSAAAIQLHKKILENTAAQQNVNWGQPKAIPANCLGVFSYALTEVKILPEWAYHCDGLMLIEPSTSQDGRALLQMREKLIENGFFAWAPCPHQLLCPLLHHSNHDWCHDRVSFEQPEWFQQIEKHLPIKNQTLTMSYVLMRKETPPVSKARLVGDLRPEKGKSRILVCRNSEREFLTFMDRHWKNPPDLKRGDLIDWPENTEKKSNEIRVTK